MNSQPAGVFFSPHNIGSLFGRGQTKHNVLVFLSGTLRISLGPHRLMGVLNMMIMSRIGAERGWGEEKGVINQVATEGKKRLLLTMRLISQLRRAARMGQEENPWYKDQFL